MPTPPGTGGLVARLESLERRIAEHARSGGGNPVCVVRLAQNFDVAANANTVINTSWSSTAEVDTHGMAQRDAAGAYIELPHAGRWHLHFHVQWGTAQAGFDVNGRYVPNAVAAKVLRNGTDVTTNAIGSASSAFNSYATGTPPGEGTTLDVIVNDRLFSAGDRLYFGVWTRYPVAVLASVNGVSTHAAVRYLGPR